jgi:hypothetical protein
MECVYLKEAKYLGDFRIFLVFNDGKSGEVDLRETIKPEFMHYSIANEF